MLTEDIEVFFKFYSMLEQKHRFRLIVFSETALIKKIGKEYGIEVVPKVKYARL